MVIAAIDIDGTLALTKDSAPHLPTRTWGDYTAWHNCITVRSLPGPDIWPVVEGAPAGLAALIRVGAHIELVTSRTHSLDWHTREWIKHQLPDLHAHGYGLLRRPEGDFRTATSLRTAQLAEIEAHYPQDARLLVIDDRPVVAPSSRWWTLLAPRDWSLVAALPLLGDQ